jgi:hypothetical protein
MGLATDKENGATRYKLFVLFSAGLIAVSLLRLPDSLSFDNVALCDLGSNLTAQFLVAHGYRPTLDFGYAYGLLPVLLARLWFAAFGLNPIAYQALMVACGLAMAWALATITARLALGVVGIALMFIAVGVAIQATYPAFTHALEAVLLCFALAEQCQGRLRSALVLAALSVLTKPSMGYIYSLILIVLAAAEARKSKTGIVGFMRTVMPAAITFFAASMLVVLPFGADLLVRTLFPVSGAAAYHALNYGFFTGSGSAFWRQPGRSWVIYFVDASGFWIAATIFLVCAAVWQIGRILRGLSSPNLRSEILITCAIVHVAFLILAFGNRWSWIYYSYVLVIGSVIAAELGGVARRIGILLCVLALLSWTDVVFWGRRLWRTTEPDAATAGLWASPLERAEWLGILSEARGRKAVMLDTAGAADLLFPGFEQPVTLFLFKGLMTPAEIQRKVAAISGADLVVVPNIGGTCGGIPPAPEFDAAIAGFGLTREKYFDVYHRKGADSRR